MSVSVSDSVSETESESVSDSVSERDGGIRGIVCSSFLSLLGCSAASRAGGSLRDARLWRAP